MIETFVLPYESPVRAGGDAGRDDYTAEQNERTLVIVHLEGRRGLDNLEAVLAVDGVDVSSSGPYDLSQALGVPGQVTADVVVETMEDPRSGPGRGQDRRRVRGLARHRDRVDRRRRPVRRRLRRLRAAGRGVLGSRRGRRRAKLMAGRAHQ